MSLDELDGFDWAGAEPGAGLEPPHPVNWNLLTAAEAAVQWAELDGWLHWLRRTYGLTASVLPPLWHRHPELVWELSALHLLWVSAYDPTQSASAPQAWHQDFAMAQQRLRDWVAASSTRLDRDRPTRQTVWPGEPAAEPIREVTITNRAEDFARFVRADIARRQEAEHVLDRRSGRHQQ